MSTTTTNPGPLPWNQRYADDFETVQTHLDGRQAEIHTSMPGTITSFDAKTMTATVQPAIQALYRDTDGTTKPITITTISDVPVHFPGGGGHCLTFPVKQGDGCQISFQERSIDFWHQHGGTQQPSDTRMHDINDAVVHVGLRAQTNLPQGGASANTVQLRADDGKTVLDLDGKNQLITMGSGDRATAVQVDAQGKSIHLSANSIVFGSSLSQTPSERASTILFNIDVENSVVTIAVGSSTITMTESAIAISAGSVTIQGREFMSHMHAGVQRGGADTDGVV